MISVRREVLSVENLTVELRSGISVVEAVSFSVAAGETLGLVGESGSGKTTVALAMSGYVRPGMRIASGSIRVSGESVDLRNETAARKIRGRVVAHVPQDPVSNLNPSLRVGASIKDVLLQHAPDRPTAADVGAALDRVHLPSSTAFQRRFPHELSGGQQQRVLIACALVCGPPLIVLDEPTTGLDVVTQAHILDEIAELHRERQVGMLYVSHDLAVVSQVADRIAVMYAGRVVEEGPAAEVLEHPRHPYTRGLVQSSPDHLVARRLHGIPGIAVGLDDRPSGCAFAPRCLQKQPRCESELPALEDSGDGRSVRCFEAHRTPALQLGERVVIKDRPRAEPVLALQDVTAVHSGRGGVAAAVRGVSFSVARSECVALVGESGSGKTTIARVVLGLHAPASGVVMLGGQAVAAHAKDRPREQRRKCQIVFQNPYESLNPRHRVGVQVSRPACLFHGVSRRDAQAETARLLERVRLPLRVAAKYPSELSGGERQRVAIARALAARPDLIVCDEITSSLDVSVQAAVIELLADLKTDLGLALLFITHNLGVVAAIADYVLVLADGAICETGSVADVFGRPQAAATKELLASAPSIQGVHQMTDALAEPR